MVQRGTIRLQHIRIDEQVADILTKPFERLNSYPSERDLESWKDPPMRVLLELDIELWELLGAWGSYWSYMSRG